MNQIDLRVADTAWARFAYSPGEEVVLRLDGVTPWLLREGCALPDGSAPPWTIARIVSRVLLEDRPHYALNFLHQDDACICMAPESAIEGVA
jgi:hypothetical protein